MARASPPLRIAPDGRRLQLVFADDFDRFRPLGEKGGVWRTTYGDGTQTGLDRRTLSDNGELELYVDSRLADGHGSLGLDPFRAHNGYLDILAEPTPRPLVTRLEGHPYISGVITTQPTFSQRYGYFEIRAKLPSGKGLWPAFWLLPEDMSWPPEIDVFESVGDASKIYSTVHSNLRPSADISAKVRPNMFHTYAVAWDKSRTAFFVDGREIGGQATPPDLNKPMFMIANLAVGGTWPGNPDGTTAFPAKLTIDYIRAYRFTP